MRGRTPSLKSGPSSGEKFVGIRHFDVTASFSGLVVVRLPKPVSQQQQEVEDYRDSKEYARCASLFRPRSRFCRVLLVVFVVCLFLLREDDDDEQQQQ